MTYQQPKPDDRSDNVEKLQNMVQNTIENIHEAESSMKTADHDQQEAIREKNERRRESITSYRDEIKDEYQAQQDQ